jgi:cysteinyl-tRNA synthetase
MSMKMLGESFDLHLGGEDLKFPHHEDEIAQSEGATGKPFVKYWLHGAFLLVEGKKMSKSLGNFFTLRDLLAKGFTGREIRYLLLSAHYRETFNFTLEGLQGARAALARIDECMSKLKEVAGQVVANPDQELIKKVELAMDNDLNVSAVWGTIFEWVRELNRALSVNQLSPAQASAALFTWRTIGMALLGLNMLDEIEVPADIAVLLEAREAARKAKDFKKSDAIRDELKAKGWAIEDTAKGPKLKRI